ncbi:MAG: helix-turn-helix domain-containing protein [Candidatus Aenigmarchaeota archaeon]|nr:helix-turn-helix domain-containing protein [Candidatus Aenigmarchaeota archaeon]
MRRGKEFYDKNYQKVMELHKQGKGAREISSELKISYSAAYHWVKGLRKPSAGNVTDFLAFLRTKGPTPAAEIKQQFQKHNELFLISGKRGEPVKRYILSRKLRDYGTWYFLEGQEDLLRSRIRHMFETIKSFADKAKEADLQ